MNVGYYSASDHDRLDRMRSNGSARSYVIYTLPNGDYAICTGIRRHDDKPPLAKDAIAHGEVVDCVLNMSIGSDADLVKVKPDKLIKAWDEIKRHRKNKKAQELIAKLELSFGEALKPKETV
jgi:hypothetical protein